MLSTRYLLGRAAIRGYYTGLDAQALAAKLTADSAELRGRALDGFWRGAKEIRPENLIRNVRARANTAGVLAADDHLARLQRTNTELARTKADLSRIAYPLLGGLIAVGIVAPLDSVMAVAARRAVRPWWAPSSWPTSGGYRRAQAAELAYHEVAATPDQGGLLPVARTRARWALVSLVCFVGGLALIAVTAALL